jgi:hypothetical protein
MKEGREDGGCVKRVKDAKEVEEVKKGKEVKDVLKEVKEGRIRKGEGEKGGRG